MISRGELIAAWAILAIMIALVIARFLNAVEPRSTSQEDLSDD